MCFLQVLFLLLGPIMVMGTSAVDLIEDNSCYKELMDMVWGIFRLEKWALTMLDAVGKPEANILGWNLGWAGSYAECIGVKQGSIEGQHCWITAVFENSWTQIPNHINEFPLIGICVPKSCKNHHFQPFTKYTKEIANKLSSQLLVNASLTMAIDCEYRNNPMNVTSLMAIAIGCLLLTSVVIGTIIDLKNSTMPFSRFLLHFSLYTNGRKLLATDTGNANTFSEMDALKAIAMALVIYTHSFTFLYRTKNRAEVTMYHGHWFMLLVAQTYPVDIFLFVAGFLTFNAVVRKPPKDNKWRFLCSYIINRYIRLSIVPLAILFVTRNGLFYHSISGVISAYKKCPNFWWRKALLVSNFWSMYVECFAPWWFLPVSMQLHLLSLCVIIPLLYKRYRMCVLNGSALLLMSWCWVGWRCYQLDTPPLYVQQTNSTELKTYLPVRGLFYNEIYQTSVYHVGPYLTGMGLAWVLFKHKEGISINKMREVIGWVLTSILLFLTLYGVYFRPNRMWKSIHTALATTMFGLSLAFLILLCHARSNGIVSRCLRWKYWLTLSKLGLSAYLIHLSVIEYFYLTEVDSVYFRLSLLWAYFLRHWTITYPLAIATTLTIEMPLDAILNSILKR